MNYPRSPGIFWESLLDFPKFSRNLIVFSVIRLKFHPEFFQEFFGNSSRSFPGISPTVVRKLFQELLGNSSKSSMEIPIPYDGC